jgi:hypothetical protein
LNDDIEAGFLAGASRALRNRAAVQQQRAADGTSPAGDKFPGVMIRSLEAALATHIAGDLEALAGEILVEVPL